MKDSINISVDVNFIERQSDIASNQFVFSYTVKITNNGEIGAQLLTRHWKIEDESGKIEDVIGEGVVGQQPHLSPGESYEYTSGAVLKTQTGSMHGSYGMIDDLGNRFDAQIPLFVLSRPYTLH